MFERIVVGVSKAATADEAVRYATQLAEKFGSELHLVIAFDASGSGARDESREHAEGKLESIALEHLGKTFTYAFPEAPAAAILRVAGDVDADLIVVGNKGMRGARRILGSVPNDVAHKAPCSVLIVATT